jgi:transposase
VLATALVAGVADPRAFRSGRDFSAWIGLAPKQHSSERKGNSAISASEVITICPAMVTAGALAVIRYAKKCGTKHRPWLTKLLARRPTKIAAVALANKAKNGIGHDGQGRALQGTRRTRDVNEASGTI